jgi:hypothetical protein
MPNVYPYPPYKEIPTDAVLMRPGPTGPVVDGPIPANEVCSIADAQNQVDAIAPLFPGQKLVVVDNSNTGIYFTKYGSDPRKQWGIAIEGTDVIVNGLRQMTQTFTTPTGSAIIGSLVVPYAQSLIEAAAVEGVGHPGHWIVGGNFVNWVVDPVSVPAPTFSKSAAMQAIETSVAVFNAAVPPDQAIKIVFADQAP